MRRPDRQVLALAGVAALLAVPPLVAGPNFLADDWFHAENATRVGFLDVGSARQVGRPGARLVYGMVFDVLGPHPVPHRLLLAVLTALNAALLLLLLRRFLERRTALVAAATWTIVPTHLALERWSSASQASVALGLLLAGALLVLRPPDGHPAAWRQVTTAALLGAAVASYELVVAAAVAVPVVAIVDRLRHGSPSALAPALWALPTIAALAWNLDQESVYPVARGRPDVGGLVAGHFGFGLADGDVALLVGRVTAVMLLALIARRIVDGDGSTTSKLLGDERRAPLLSGLALLLVGIAPLIDFYTNFRGLHDRLTAVSGIGAALMIAALLRTAEQRGPVVGTVAVVAVVGLALAGRAGMEATWDRVGDDGVELVARQDAILPSGGIATVTESAEEEGVESIGDGWHLSAALRLRRGGEAPLVCLVTEHVTDGPGCP